MDVTDALDIVSFVPEELEEEVFVNAIVQFNVKVGRENADAPEFWGAPIAVGSLKNTGKTVTNVESATQSPNNGSLASSKGPGNGSNVAPNQSQGGGHWGEPGHITKPVNTPDPNANPRGYKTTIRENMD
ncbi:hypothetical protein [Brevibacillus migulae]|uniref:hypothetical protein n=1 Tax=Brevibacillus migulae TaxID=1644114 RepID=UPI00106E7129|nr:hypothetical protein [Brevibacillus migulae]